MSLSLLGAALIANAIGTSQSNNAIGTSQSNKLDYDKLDYDRLASAIKKSRSDIDREEKFNEYVNKISYIKNEHTKIFNEIIQELEFDDLDDELTYDVWEEAYVRCKLGLNLMVVNCLFDDFRVEISGCFINIPLFGDMGLMCERYKGCKFVSDIKHVNLFDIKSWNNNRITLKSSNEFIYLENDLDCEEAYKLYKSINKQIDVNIYNVSMECVEGFQYVSINGNTIIKPINTYNSYERNIIDNNRGYSHKSIYYI